MPAARTAVPGCLGRDLYADIKVPIQVVFKGYRADAQSAFQYRAMVAVAQQVEHWIVIPEVAGSRPVGHPIFSRV